MYLNGYSVRVIGGSEKDASGYVEMSHGAQYSLQLRNSRNVLCDAEVTIDGKHVGTFRIDKYGSVRLERSADDDRRFTFYLRDSEEGREVELDHVSKGELGLVQVTFKPEVEPPTVVYRKTVIYEAPKWIPDDNRTTWGSTSGGPELELGLDDDFDTAEPMSRGMEADCYYSADLSSATFGGGNTKGLRRTPSSSGFQAGGTGMSGHSRQNFYDVPALNYDEDMTTTISLRLVGKKRKTRGPLKPVQKSNPIPPPVWTISSWIV